MRTLSLFALALAGLAAVTDDASAGIFRRNRGANNACCAPAPTSCCGTAGYGGYGGGMYGRRAGGMYSAPYGGMYGANYGSATPCCGSSVASGSYWGGTTVGMAGQGTGWVDGQNVIQTTDGHTYVRGSDGVYYASGSTLGGFTSQPYTSGYYGSYPGTTYGSYYYPGTNYYGSRMYNGYYSYPGVYQAGYPGSYYYNGGIYPAGGTSPLTMPGVTLPGGINIGPGGVTLPSPMPNK